MCAWLYCFPDGKDAGIYHARPIAKYQARYLEKLDCKIFDFSNWEAFLNYFDKYQSDCSSFEFVARIIFSKSPHLD